MASTTAEICDSEYVHPNGDWETTYKLKYKPCEILQPKREYHQPLVFESKDPHQLPVREFPYMPETPHRVGCYDIPIGPGLSTPDMKTWMHLKPKSIMKFPAPSKTFFTEPKPSSRQVKFMIPETQGEWPLVHQPDGKKWRTKSAYEHAKTVLKKSLPAESAESNTTWASNAREKFLATLEAETKAQREDLCEKLRHYYRWTSSTKRAMHDGCPYTIQSPKNTKTTIFEMRPDEVSLRNARYAAKPEDYQAMGPAWDKVQVRGTFGRRSPVEKDNQTPLTTRWPTNLAHPVGRDFCGEQLAQSHIRELVRSDSLSFPFQRPLPGYAGFIPRQVTESKVEKLPIIDDSRESVTTATHRKFPANEYQTFTKFGHKSPLSGTITLTSPYCPFNKIIPPEPQSRPYQLGLF